MKFLVTFFSSILVCSLILSVVPCMGEAEVYNNILRLHIIAESDATEDQELKLKVRDAVLEYLSATVSECASFEEAYETVAALESEIASAAKDCIFENGQSCSVSVELGNEKYPRRDYGDTVLPAGEYASLRITLGEGEGKNWWCVLFPSVCTGFAKDSEEYAAVGFTPREYKIITGQGKGWKVRFRLLEVLSEIIGFEYP